MLRTTPFLLLAVASLVIGAAGDARSQPVTAVLDASRTTGAAPLAVFFDATGSSCSSCGRPYHDLHYSWNFGDDQNALWARSGKPKRSAYGPIAAHVFEQPGTYLVTLVVRDPAGNTTTRTQTIDVLSPDSFWSGTRTICFSTSGNFEGCPAGAQHQVTSSFNSAMAACEAPNRRCLFRRGETFDSVEWNLNSAGPSMVGAFGSGSTSPTLRFANDGAAVRFGESTSDWRFVDLQFQGPGKTPYSKMFTASRRVSNVLILSTRSVPGSFTTSLSFSGSSLDLVGDDLHDGLFVVDNDWVDASEYHMFVASRRLAVLGNRLSRVDREYIIRLAHCETCIISNNQLLGPTPKAVISGRSHDQNGSCSAGCGRPTSNLVISDNLLEVGLLTQFTFTGANQSSETARGQNFLVERNLVRSHTGGTRADAGIDVRSTAGVTVRNNIIQMDGFGRHLGILVHGSATDVAVENNTCFSADSTQWPFECVRLNSGSARVLNNLAYFPNASNRKVLSGQAAPLASGGNTLATESPFAVNVPRDSADFRLRDGAPAIDSGTNAGAQMDFMLSLRPLGPGYDVGAFENGGAPLEPQVPAAPVLLP